jgi:hypothetical protein
MDIFGPPASPDVPDDQRTSNALVKLIKKLRWVGMKDEEERLQNKLKEHDMELADSVVANPRDTD